MAYILYYILNHYIGPIIILYGHLVVGKCQLYHWFIRVSLTIHWIELLHWITYTGLTFDLHVHVTVILYYIYAYSITKTTLVNSRMFELALYRPA